MSPCKVTVTVTVTGPFVKSLFSSDSDRRICQVTVTLEKFYHAFSVKFS
jgi:hypothetical protein